MLAWRKGQGLGHPARVPRVLDMPETRALDPQETRALDIQETTALELQETMALDTMIPRVLEQPKLRPAKKNVQHMLAATPSNFIFSYGFSTHLCSARQM